MGKTQHLPPAVAVVHNSGPIISPKGFSAHGGSHPRAAVPLVNSARSQAVCWRQAPLLEPGQGPGASVVQLKHLTGVVPCDAKGPCEPTSH